ncbi:hypothetical protein K505DRAFT_366071 [Melanomma pulvis-pyrius CBS 109.77]|uniref:Apple domain-containing protein n=1 Tax=Melanomma pulvis-pyrius CBS 109.77 TaxID=1314802 RepID=A0A6A6WYA9_9PLEO|nr:hypothetical protein K505DRAFT_366071 [Melanomma pulvis-pyrius CBS 109.77]
MAISSNPYSLSRTSFIPGEDATIQIDDRESSGLEVDHSRSGPEIHMPQLAVDVHDTNWNGGEQYIKNRGSETPTVFEEEKVIKIRRTTAWLIVTIVVVLAVIAGMVGGFLAKKRHDANGESSNISDSTTNVPTALTSPSPSTSLQSQPSQTTVAPFTITTAPTPTYSFVTAGTTGMASLPCPVEYTTVAPRATTPATFNIHCGYDSDEVPIRIVGWSTEYSLWACLRRCGENSLCDAAVFSANLTMTLVGEHPQNCLLKEGPVQPTLRSWSWRVIAVKDQ